MKKTMENSTEGNLIERYVSDICEVLGFSEDERPEISYDTSHFATATMMAQCRSDGVTSVVS